MTSRLALALLILVPSFSLSRLLGRRGGSRGLGRSGGQLQVPRTGSFARMPLTAASRSCRTACTRTPIQVRAGVRLRWLQRVRRGLSDRRTSGSCAHGQDNTGGMRRGRDRVRKQLPDTPRRVPLLYRLRQHADHPSGRRGCPARARRPAPAPAPGGDEVLGELSMSASASRASSRVAAKISVSAASRMRSCSDSCSLVGPTSSSVRRTRP